MKKWLLSCVVFIFLFNNVSAQIDTSFWFVAPEVAQSHGDRPIVMRFATLAQPATITVSQPANPAFPVQTIVLGTNEAQTLDLTGWIDMIENKPADAVLNYGFKISSTAPIMAYYEVNPTCACNPDIFTLKGKNALGTSFFTPFQNYLNNSSYARSAFNIVATEDNTVVTIVPTQNIVGHSANVPFSIFLNKGQTYSGEASSPQASLHAGGTVVTATLPVAITISDDTMEGAPYGGCADIMGDQIVPVGIIGDEYIALKGYLNGPDKVYVLGTVNNTNVFADGAFVATINAGQTYTHTLSNPTVYITSSSPVYVLHTSGFGCEVGGALLPSIECTGSNNVAFVRSTNEFFALNILVPAGGENSFVLNGDPASIPASVFQAVPGTNSAWMYAQFNASSLIPVAQASRLENNQSKFHLSVIHGGANTGCRYGYFSDYASYRYEIELTSEIVCEGDILNMTVSNVPGGLYQWDGPNDFSAQGNSITISDFASDDAGTYIISGYEGLCTISPDTVELEINPTVTGSIFHSICEGDVYSFGNGEYILEGNYEQTFTAISSCDSIVTLHLTVNPVYNLNMAQTICEGESISFGNDVYTESGIYSMLLETSEGCDSLVTLSLTVTPGYTQDLAVSVCHGENYILGGNSYDSEGTYPVMFQTENGCDSLVNLHLTVNPLYTQTVSPVICNGEIFNFNGTSYTESGSYPHLFESISGCDSLITVNLTVNPVYTSTLPVSLCAGESFSYAGNVYNSAGNYPVSLLSENGCDSIVTLSISQFDNYEISIFDTACYSQPYTMAGNVYTVSGVYMIDLDSSHGCDSLITLYLHVQPEGFSDYYFPNVFTPNGDDKNDEFQLQGSVNRITSFSIAIYNRWGILVYQSDNPYFHWDGRTEDEMANEGVYYYIAQFSSACAGSDTGEEIEFKGNITLMK